MTQESPKTDYLKGLFSQLPQTKLPGTFRSDLMRKIQFEAARQHRREEHLSLIATILASLVMIALATSSLIYLEIPAVRLDTGCPSSSRRTRWLVPFLYI